MEQIDQYLHVYFIAGIGYNVLSQILFDLCGRKLAPTEPTNGILIMSLVYVILLLEEVLPVAQFLGLMALWTLAILRFGVVQHVLNFDPEGYWSRASWALAILINVIGVSLLSAMLVDHAL